MTRRGSARAAGAAVLAAALLGFFFADSLRLRFDTTTDEPSHLPAARELRYGPGLVSNFEHPAVMKLAAAAGLSRTPPMGPPSPLGAETRDGRRAFPLLFALLVGVAGLFALRRVGAAAGLLVAGLLVAEPTFRAHAAIVQSDVLLALFLTASCAALDGAARSRRRRNAWLVAAGVLYGLALVSKFSALPFLAVVLGVAAVALRTAPVDAAAAPKRRERRTAPRARTPLPWRGVFSAVGLLAGVAILTAVLVEEAAAASTRREDLVRGAAAKFQGLREEEAAVRLASEAPKGLAAYGLGLLWVKASAVPGARANYFFGRVSGTGFLAYFPVALGVKLTAASVLLLAAVVVAVVAALAATARRARGSRRRLLRLLAARAGIPAALGAAYVGAAALSDVNIGVRHVLPAVPLLLVAAAAALRTLLRRRPALLRAAVAITLAAALAEAYAQRGREIPFGNLFVGGPAGVRRVLSDSNVEWGEAQGRVLERAARRDLGRAAIMALAVDELRFAEAGVPLVETLADRPLDSVFVSVHLFDLGRAFRSNRETYSKMTWLREWLVPLVDELERRGGSPEPIGDSYLLFRLRPEAAAR